MLFNSSSKIHTLYSLLVLRLLVFPWHIMNMKLNRDEDDKSRLRHTAPRMNTTTTPLLTVPSDSPSRKDNGDIPLLVDLGENSFIKGKVEQRRIVMVVIKEIQTPIWYTTSVVVVASSINNSYISWHYLLEFVRPGRNKNTYALVEITTTNVAVHLTGLSVARHTSQSRRDRSQALWEGTTRNFLQRLHRARRRPVLRVQ
jgi:hypothetical protein